MLASPVRLPVTSPHGAPASWREAFATLCNIPPVVASLSTTPGAIHGMREYQLVDCLQRPGRDLSSFKTNVLDKLATRAWYLHNSPDGRLFFKNQQNLAVHILMEHSLVVNHILVG
jgi:hypothetical protein